jgi:hypothetical protein
MNYYESFVSFVNRQDPRRAIEHTSWDVCAVGEWAKSEGITQALQQGLGLVDKSLVAEFGFPHEVVATLNDGWLCHNKLSLYADLQAYLATGELP